MRIMQNYSHWENSQTEYGYPILGIIRFDYDQRIWLEFMNFYCLLEVNMEVGKTYDQVNWLCPQDSISKYFNASSYY